MRRSKGFRKRIKRQYRTSKRINRARAGRGGIRL
jgi:hypothetical protein